MPLLTDWPAWLPDNIVSWLLRAALLAVLLFWIVGAYNRLMRHRHALAQAWGQIDELLSRRAAALEALMAPLAQPLADEAGSLQALLQAQERQQQAARAVRLRPTHAEALQAWAQAEAGLASPMARVQALLDQHPELAGSEAVKPPRQQLQELVARLGYARQVFNDAADVYNQAVEEFPTRLLMPLFGMRPTARI